MPSCRLASASSSSAGYHTGIVQRTRNLLADGREHLHQSARIRDRHRARIEARLLANQSGDERRIEVVRLGVARQFVAIDDRKEQTVGARVALAGVDQLLREIACARTAGRGRRTRGPSRAVDRETPSPPPRARRIRISLRCPCRVARAAPRARARCRPRRTLGKESARAAGVHGFSSSDARRALRSTTSAAGELAPLAGRASRCRPPPTPDRSSSAQRSLRRIAGAP